MTKRKSSRYSTKSLDYAETQGVGLPRRIKYVFNLAKFAAMLDTKDFEKATKADIEAAMRDHGRLGLSEQTDTTFRIMVKRFYRWLKDPNDEDYPPEVKWLKATIKNSRNHLPEELLTQEEVMTLIKTATSIRVQSGTCSGVRYESGGNQSCASSWSKVRKREL